MSVESYQDDEIARRRNRIWGAIVLFAIAIIVLPLLLDGAGSESQFPRVERLPEVPSLARENTGDTVLDAQMRSSDEPDSASELLQGTASNGDSDAILAERKLRQALQANTDSTLKAWVVRADSFRAESDALALRDRLRQAGYASFVKDRDESTDLFQVLVGPMIKEPRALEVRKLIARLLNTDATVESYP